MRVYERVKQHAKAYPQFLIVDMVPGLMRDFGMGRTAAIRYCRIAIDVLGLPYDTDRRREDRRDNSMMTATRQGLSNAKAAGWPNGKPGRYAAKGCATTEPLAPNDM